MDYRSRKQLKTYKNPPGFFRLKNPARVGKRVGPRVSTHASPDSNTRKTKNQLKHLEKENVPQDKRNKNSSNMRDMQMRTLQQERLSPTEKCDSAAIGKVKQRNEETTKVLKKEQKSRKRRMRTCKGPKGITPPGPQHTFAGKEKESCEELEHRTEPFRQQPVETLQRGHHSQPTV